jgi:riboflavin kinase/FMN adenylyltransferase
VLSRLHHTIQSYNPERPSLVAIGNFDGVHEGHQQVVTKACELAVREELTPLVLTFEPHPAQVLFDAKLARLTNLPRKVELLLRLHPELRVVVEPFEKELSLMAPDVFARRVLKQGLGAKRVVVGRNFRFGHRRAGDLALLVELGEALGFEATPQELVADSFGPYSSTRIREAIASGDLLTATTMLGRPHALTGRVIRGDQRGRTIGFPTANLADVTEVQPKHGVYATAVDIAGDAGFTRLGLGALNIGVRPTLAAGPSVEVHLLEFNGDLYGATLQVHLLARLRDEQRFDGLEALKQQLRHDVAQVKHRFEGLVPAPAAGAAWF